MQCSFCGKDDKQTKLVSGTFGYICEDCAKLAQHIFEITEPVTAVDVKEVPKPKKIKEFLDKYKEQLPSDFTVNFLVGKAKEVLLNDKTPDSEKKEALKILEEAKKKYPKMQENIDKILKEYENKNNKTNK